MAWYPRSEQRWEAWKAWHMSAFQQHIYQRIKASVGAGRDVFVFYFYFYCILGFGVRVKNMQDCCIGTHLAVWIAAFLPITYIWHFPPCCLSPTPHPSVPSLFPLVRPQCVMLPSLCPCVLIFQHPPMSKNIQCLVFCSYVSLLRMMVSSFIHVPAKDMNSSFIWVQSIP